MFYLALKTHLNNNLEAFQNITKMSNMIE